MKDYEVLLKELDHPESDIRQKAQTRLIEIGSHGNIELLVETIKTSGADVFPLFETIIATLDNRSVDQALITQAEDNLIYLLQNADEYDCVLAATILGKRKVARAIPFISSLLLTKNLHKGFNYNPCFHGEYIESICDALGHFSGSLIIDYLIPGLEEGWGPWNVIGVIARIDDVDVTAHLLQAYSCADSVLQKGIITALGALGDYRALPLLVQSLSDKVDREQSILGLERIGDLRAVPVLLELLSDIEAHELPCVIDAFVTLGAKEAVNPLLDILQTYLAESDAGESNWGFLHACRAIDALGKLSDSIAFIPLIQAASQKEELFHPVLLALQGMSTLEIIKSLLLALDKNNPLTAIINQQSDGTNEIATEYDIIVQWLQSKDKSIRDQTAKTLYSIISTATTSSLDEKYHTIHQQSMQLLFNITEDQTSAEYLILTLNDTDKAERLLAVKTILSIKEIDPQVLIALEGLLTDENKIICAYVKKALRTVKC